MKVKKKKKFKKNLILPAKVGAKEPSPSPNLTPIIKGPTTAKWDGLYQARSFGSHPSNEQPRSKLFHDIFLR